MRRIRQAYRLMITGTVVALLLIIVLNIGLDLTSVNGEQMPAEKTYITITIEKDDTLWNLSDQYMNDNYYSRNDFIKEVKSINSLTTDKIVTGNQLVLPIVTDL